MEKQGTSHWQEREEGSTGRTKGRMEQLSEDFVTIGHLSSVVTRGRRDTTRQERFFEALAHAVLTSNHRSFELSRNVRFGRFLQALQFVACRATWPQLERFIFALWIAASHLDAWISAERESVQFERFIVTLWDATGEETYPHDVSESILFITWLWCNLERPREVKTTRSK